MSLKPESQDVRIAELLRSNIRKQVDDGIEAVNEQYGVALHALARKLVGDADLAEEVCNDTLLALYSWRQRVSGDGLKALLFRIMRRKVVDHLRKKRHLQTVELTILNEPYSDISNSLDAKAIDAEQLEHALRILQGDDKQIAELVVDGYRADEIAKRMNIKIGSVRTKITRLHQRLKRASGER